MDDHTLLETIQMAIKLSKLEQHPVGSIYTSTLPTDPHELFGGTWKPIQDTFLWCAGPKHAAGTTGGEETHKLTVEESPQHTHKVAVFTGGNGDGGDYYARYISPDGHLANYSKGNAKLWHVWKDGMNKTWGINNGFSGTGDLAGNALPTGENQPHNNMPPYKAVYAWQRVK